MSQKEVVAAIDFGTCNTRLAFGVQNAESSKLSDIELVVMNDWRKAPDVLMTMAPTTLLVDEKKEVAGYGWEAEDMFRTLPPADKKSYYLLKNFKMALHQKNVSLKAAPIFR